MKRNNSSPTSKPTSVDIRTLFLKAIATNNQKGDFSKEEIVIADEYTAKINRLIVEAKMQQIRDIKNSEGFGRMSNQFRDLLSHMSQELNKELVVLTKLLEVK